MSALLESLGLQAEVKESNEYPDQKNVSSHNEGSFFSQLREDLDLYPGAPQQDGSPTWTVHDPVSNRFIHIGWVEFEILRRWNLENTDAITAAVNLETTLSISGEDVRIVGIFLTNHNLLKADSLRAVQQLAEATKKKGKAHHNFLRFLFFRIPLFHPDSFLSNTLWIVRPLFSKLFMIILGVIALLSVFLVLRQWDLFIHTSLHFFNWDVIGYYLTALFFVKCLHELGHAYCCKFLGLHVPVIGLALLVFWPFLYTDTGESWKLASRKQRLAIGSAGIIAELILAVTATFAWTVLPHGLLRDIAFFLATTSWIMTVAININPFMRWDGYYLLSDITGINNLQSRANNLALWRLRELLFGFADPAPEQVSTGRQNFMIFYALGGWIYRFFLFLGITILVYQFFIKVAAICFALLTFYGFIITPIKNELMVYFSRRKDITWNKHSIITGIFVAMLLLLFFLPWRTYCLLPAAIKPSISIDLYPPDDGKIAAIHIKEGDLVRPNEPLLDISSPKLDFELGMAALEIKKSTAEVQKATNERYRDRKNVAAEQKIKAEQKFLGLQKRRKNLHITSLVEGTIVDLPSYIIPGIWVGKEQRLGRIAGKASSSIYAYATSDQLVLLEKGADGIYYFNNNEKDKIEAKITAINSVSAETLIEPMLASIYGGPIRVSSRGANLTPVRSVFLVQLQPSKEITLSSISSGYVRVKCKPWSYASHIWRNIHSLIIRESDF